MTEIRAMQISDLEAVVCIEEKLFSQPWSKQGFLDSLQADNTIYLVALADGIVAGYCGLLQVLDEADITNVAVDEAFQRRGIARELLQELFVRAQKKGITALTLEVRKSNVPAISLYESLGFENCGIRRNFYEKPLEDAVIMWKR